MIVQYEPKNIERIVIGPTLVVLIYNLFLFYNIMFYNISVSLVKMHFYSLGHPLVLRQLQPR